MKSALVLASLLLAGAGMCQARGITIRAVNQKAETVFADIMRQTGKNFIYTPDILRNLKVSVSAADEPLDRVLERMFRDTGVSFRIKGNNVILSAKKRKTVPVVRRFAVSGFVRDAETGEPLPGAVVASASSSGRKGSATNAYGFYSISLPSGETDLTSTCFDFLMKRTGTFRLRRDTTIDFSLEKVKELEEVVVTASRNRLHAVESTDIGSSSLSASMVKATPVILGESDVIKTLQLDPGVSAGVEGLAGMYVHGGNSDENMYMLDNIPLYNINHLGGLFSAFNTDVIRSVDFYKSSFPTKYDGRLSSFLDVHTKDGRTDRHHGAFTLGLTSGSIGIDGPIGKSGKTSYVFGLRRSWLDLLTLPATAIISASIPEEKFTFGYNYTDLNLKLTHRFSDRSRLTLSGYYGEDYLHAVNKNDWTSSEDEIRKRDETVNNMRWGNILVTAGWNYVFSPKIFGEFTGAYTRYFSRLRHSEGYRTDKADTLLYLSESRYLTDNSIDDWILKGDFDWRPDDSHRVNFGGALTFHSFQPGKGARIITKPGIETEACDNTRRYFATELNAYIGDDWNISDRWRLNAGLHVSQFHIDGKTRYGISPRLSVRFKPESDWPVKASYARATQYVHQISESNISLPTDQWVPITGSFKPQTSDKISVGGYWLPLSGITVSAEAYYKWLRNLVDYRDGYQLVPPLSGWNALLTSGKGTAKGIDFKIARESGKVTGHVAYSLMWADRKFAGRNGGRTYPARFDNRHKINVFVSWHPHEKWDFNFSWTGMSGNMVTLPVQEWNGPKISEEYEDIYGNQNYYGLNIDLPLACDINNYRLPFYHRLDLSVVRHTKRGYWTISVYNAYCARNTLFINKGDRNFKPVFQKVSLLPIIPSFSYTWLF